MPGVGRCVNIERKGESGSQDPDHYLKEVGHRLTNNGEPWEYFK